MVLFSTDDGCLFGEVDTYRTPADAASTTNTTGTTILLMPAAQLVGQPLAVAQAGIAANGDAVDITVSLAKTGIPLAIVRAAGTIQCCFVELTVTEAGRTHAGAIAAGKTAPGDVFPARVVEIVEQ